MKKIIAAFLWNATNNTISFMLLDGDYGFIYEPRQYHLDGLILKSFKSKAEKIIKVFFQEIRKAYHLNMRSQIKIEYKIVHQVSASLADFYQPNERSSFVREKFLQQYALAKPTIMPMKLSQQLRTRLKRPELDIFKKALRDMHVVKPTRKNTYQYHLWTLATHATKSNFRIILKRLTRRYNKNIRTAA